MNDTFEDLGKKLSETADMMAAKASELIEIQKLKNQIRTLKRSNNRDFSDIGKMYYEKYKSGEVIDADAAALCESISARKVKIAGYEEEAASKKDIG